MMIPSQAEYQVRYRAEPGVSSPSARSVMNSEPGYISMHEMLIRQAPANVVPWLAPAIEATWLTNWAPPSSSRYQRVTRPPMEWFTMATFAAPVWLRTELTMLRRPAALVWFEPAQL